MKKFLTFFLLVLTNICLFAEVEVVDGIEWTYYVWNGEASIEDIPKTTSGDITIPSTLGGYPVTSIGQSAFHDCYELTGITIPDSVTSIGDYAFRSCGNLTSLKIMASEINLGENVFYYCDPSVLFFYGHIPKEPSSGYGSGLFDGWDGNHKTIYISKKFISEWYDFFPSNIQIYIAGFVEDYPFVEVISAKMRENNPTIMDVKYKVDCSYPVNVRVLAFKDGVRNFANVIRPETFIENTATNVGDNIAPNVEHTISWQVPSDWNIDLANVSFEVLAQKRGDELLPLRYMTLPAVNNKPSMKISWNSINNQDVVDAFYWLYASNDADLTLSNGVLKYKNTTLMTNNSLNNSLTTISFLFTKMGYEVLSGDNLTHARNLTRNGLITDRIKQYAMKIIQE